MLDRMVMRDIIEVSVLNSDQIKVDLHIELRIKINEALQPYLNLPLTKETLNSIRFELNHLIYNWIIER